MEIWDVKELMMTNPRTVLLVFCQRTLRMWDRLAWDKVDQRAAAPNPAPRAEGISVLAQLEPFAAPCCKVLSLALILSEVNGRGGHHHLNKPVKDAED